MSWDWKGFTGLCFAGIIIFTAGIVASIFAESAINGINSRLSQSGLSQSERWNLEGSLGWWNAQSVAFIQPFNVVTSIMGIVVIVISIVYGVLSAVQETIAPRRTRLGRQLPLEEDAPVSVGVTPIREMPKQNRAQLPIRKTGFPTAAGVLMLIGSGLIGLVAIVALALIVQSVAYLNYGSANLFGNVAVSVSNLLAFGFGLSGGILSLRRKQFALSVFGSSLLLIAGLMTVAGFGYVAGVSWVAGLSFGVPVIVLAMLSLIFDSISRNEFQ